LKRRGSNVREGCKYEVKEKNQLDIGVSQTTASSPSNILRDKIGVEVEYYFMS
jgi:hypothetical protein